MKKFVSLLLTAVLLAAMLGAFALPAWADESGDTSGPEPESPVLAEAGGSDGMPPELGTTSVVSPLDDGFHVKYSLDETDREITDSPVKKDKDIETPLAVKEEGETPTGYFKLPIQPDGSVLSEGNIWIIAVVAVVVLGGIAALVIVKKKKKKPATAGGESNSEE